MTTATRHIHAVAEDPYNLGSIWLTCGYQASPHYVYNSTANGAGGTWNAVAAFDAPSASPLTNPWQCVSIGFDASRVWFQSDQTWGNGPLVYNRSTLALRWASLERATPRRGTGRPRRPGHH